MHITIPFWMAANPFFSIIIIFIPAKTTTIILLTTTSVIQTQIYTLRMEIT